MHYCLSFQLSTQEHCRANNTAAISWGYTDCDEWKADVPPLATYAPHLDSDVRNSVSAVGVLIIICAAINFLLYVTQYSRLYIRKCLLGANAPNFFVEAEGQIAKYPVARIILSAYYLTQDSRFLFNLLKLTFAILGMTNPLYFSFHLLAIAEISPDLKNVMRAVTQNGKSLVLTAIFGVIIIYLYAIVGFVFFREHYVTDDEQLLCTDLFQCTITTLTGGLRKGDIGEVLQDTDWGSTALLIWQFTFFVVVITILLNIIFGIIIDTFGELREHKNVVENDMTNNCFVCSIERYTIDRFQLTTGGFDHHIHEDHNMWHVSYTTTIGYFFIFFCLVCCFTILLLFVFVLFFSAQLA
jgi:Ca2+/Na+ antiporter